mmetsp:Transcript_15929/g.38737  ORF Transcript_15929/g.38737 Transcript_15929/m.38737 type:complete len:212 (-) Transcript_15929:837-1472(-)
MGAQEAHYNILCRLLAVRPIPQFLLFTQWVIPREGLIHKILAKQTWLPLWRLRHSSLLLLQLQTRVYLIGDFEIGAHALLRIGLPSQHQGIPHRQDLSPFIPHNDRLSDHRRSRRRYQRRALHFHSHGLVGLWEVLFQSHVLEAQHSRFLNVRGQMLHAIVHDERLHRLLITHHHLALVDLKRLSEACAHQPREVLHAPNSEAVAQDRLRI